MGQGVRDGPRLGETRGGRGHLAFSPPEVGLEWEAWHSGLVWIWIFSVLVLETPGQVTPLVQGQKTAGELCIKRGLK